jgi:hypothetical protein
MLLIKLVNDWNNLEKVFRIPKAKPKDKDDSTPPALEGAALTFISSFAGSSVVNSPQKREHEQPSVEPEDKTSKKRKADAGWGAVEDHEESLSRKDNQGVEGWGTEEKGGWGIDNTGQNSQQATETSWGNGSDSKRERPSKRFITV